MHLLFVCTGNICRSPIGERLAAAYGAERQIPDLVTSSAGTRAVIAHPIHDQAALVLEGLGGDATNFSARQLTPKIAAQADLILTMTRDHRDKVLSLAPRLLRSTYTLSEAAQLASLEGVGSVADFSRLRPLLKAGAAEDVPDPINQGPEVFAEVGNTIARLLAPVIELCDPLSPGRHG
ncbi:low molecular weight phosphatase family protein [Mycobacterium sp. MS1601]|uniref:arsenate reductase/protein-tyrosine-phosphatase family protein n=1 Tax=Mycobacterium sp. MS1601 TaxID=1936029 RepID=UPI000979110A|nr:low molecular weight phosphatase family protein [Mycobacterium sp. MS1601]AQA01849.1 low molecular weight phosphatase family protein [Mycobacterium sp. MS1601]